MVNEVTFSSNYIQHLKDHTLSAATQCLQQEQQQQQEYSLFNSLSSNKKTIVLVKKFGTEGYLDLKTDKFSQRLGKSIKSLQKDLSLDLRLKATSQERGMLTKISRCNCAADVEDLLRELFSMQQLTPNSKFIWLALASAQTL